MQLDEARVKAGLIQMWSAGGMDALVKVMPIDMAPSGGRAIGYCTSYKFIIGRTPAEMENIVGLRSGSKLLNGAAVYAVRPLPTAAQFMYRGHSNTPEGISTTIKPAHPDYPPGLGAPQWEVFGLTQDKLVLLAAVPAGQTFRYPVAALKAA
ncbi:hypothetical protein [Sphingomonas immobilis]|uniref:Uncharacterized protein n=1 Tax=Sphingomonas immobilis TaxID=3063997 RepID=A0ABT9A0J5_9SPHN|nr:hypothetical protein [Sphingomonas sp. CA1-15]MDO7843359.1 hypothetical protein [Sphingomonas sp. CA1-15]